MFPVFVGYLCFQIAMNTIVTIVVIAINHSYCRLN